MPRLDRFGRAYMGNGDGPLSIDHATVLHEGQSVIGQCVQVLDERDPDPRHTRVIFATLLDGRRVLATYSEAEGVLEIPGSDGCNELAAGGGRFVAYRAGGIYGSLDTLLTPQARAAAGVTGNFTDGRGGAGQDGTLTIVPNRQSGSGFELIDPAGARVPVNAVAYDVCVVGPRRAIWNGGSYGWNPRRLPGARGTKVAVVNGVVYLVSWVEGIGLVAHPEDSLLGHVIEREPRAFHHDAVGIDGRLIVVYSAGVGEQPWELVRHEDVTRFLTVDLEQLLSAPPPPPDPGPTPLPPGEMDVHVTIVDYRPKDGVAPLLVDAMAEVLGDQTGVKLEWLKKVPGAQWVTDGQPTTAHTHRYLFSNVGPVIVGVRAVRAGAVLDQTGDSRIVQVRAPQTPPPPPGPGPAPTPEPTPSTAPPADLPPVTAWTAGLCFPTPYPQDGLARPHRWSLRVMRALGLSAVRINVHHERPDVLDYVQFVADAGMRPWPIIDITPHEDEHAFLMQLGGVARFSEIFAQRFPWITDIEVYNEPLSAGNLNPQRYARLCLAVCQAFRLFNHNARLFIASEPYNFDTGKEHAHWKETKRLVEPELYDGIALHPYRGKPWYWSPFGSRATEWNVIRDLAGGKLLAVTEFGWKHGIGEAEQAENITNELDEQREAGVVASFIYAHAGEYGIFDPVDPNNTWIPRHAAKAIAHYLQEKPLA